MPKLTYVDAVAENDSVYTFRFQKPRSMNHKAGQHGIFLLPGFYRPHPFSLSSAPEEPYVAFTTRVRKESRFKQRLMQLKPGDPLFMFGPVLSFTFKPRHTSHVFLAQGIGITPFRSMLVHADKKKLPFRTTLIHVDNNAHLFKSLSAEFATQAYYPSSAEEFKVILAKQKPNQQFYISGSPQFVRQTKHYLKELSVSQKNIKTDSFLGY